MTDPLNPLKERLNEAADDSGHPLTTDMSRLLGRAKKRRSRRNAGLAGAVVVTAAALVGSTVGIRAALPDDSRPAAQTKTKSPTAAPASLGKDEIVRRCLPQLKKYDDYPQYSGTGDIPAPRWRIPRDRDYVPGDVVALQDGKARTNPVLCVVPEKGHEQDPVPFSAFEPDASRTTSIAELCSEKFLPEPNRNFSTGEFHGYPDKQLPDLRGATVAAIDSAGPVVQVLLAMGRHTYSCALTPVTWDAGPRGVHSSGNVGYEISLEGSATGPSGKSIVDEDASYYYAAGTMPKDAARIEFTLATGSAFTVPVIDGAYAVLHKEPGTGGLVRVEYQVLDKDGRVLHEGTIS